MLSSGEAGIIKRVGQAFESFFQPTFATDPSSEFTPAETLRFQLRNTILSSLETLDSFEKGIKRFAAGHPDVVIGAVAVPVAVTAAVISAPAWVVGGILLGAASAACMSGAREDGPAPLVIKPPDTPDAGPLTPTSKTPKEGEPNLDPSLFNQTKMCRVPSLGEVSTPAFERLNPQESGLTYEAEFRVKDRPIPSHGPSGCLFDFEKDGDLDFYTVRGHFYLNDGSAHFQHQPNSPSGPDLAAGCLPFDYDGDDWIDLLVTGHRPRLYQNQKGSNWDDVTNPMGLDAARCLVLSAAACDIDRNGRLDLALGCLQNDALDNMERNFLFVNNGETFAEEGEKRGMSSGFFDGRGITYAISCLDINQDNAPDIYEGNDGWKYMPDRLWINNGEGFFAEQGEAFGLKEWDYETEEGEHFSSSADTMGHGIADFGLHHIPGFAISDYASRRVVNVLLGMEQNEAGDVFYREIGPEGGITDTDMTGWGLMDLDVELDGDPDFIVATGGTTGFGFPPGRFQRETQNPLYLNHGEGIFERYSTAGGDPLGRRGMTYGMLVGDLDGDYDEDIIAINHEATPDLFLNDAAIGNAFKIELACPPPNIHCIGAKVFVALDGNCSRVEEKIIGEGMGSGVEGALLFGIGVLTETRVVVRFPNGQEREWFLEAGQQHTLSQSE